MQSNVLDNDVNLKNRFIDYMLVLPIEQRGDIFRNRKDNEYELLQEKFSPSFAHYYPDQRNIKNMSIKESLSRCDANLFYKLKMNENVGIYLDGTHTIYLSRCRNLYSKFITNDVTVNCDVSNILFR